MKLILIVALISMFSIIRVEFSLGQNTTSNAPQQNNSKPEIDKLFDKYIQYEEDGITIYTTYGELKASVKINYNKDNKPESIVIAGSTSSDDILARFIADLIEQKLKAKYKDPTSSFSTFWSFESIKNNLNSLKELEFYPNFYFTKGKMYTKIKAFCINWDEMKKQNAYYDFEIETGDRSRFGGKKAESFEF